MMADKKYPDIAGEGALDQLMRKVTASQGPKASSATVCIVYLCRGDRRIEKVRNVG